LERRREPLPTRVQDTAPLPAEYDVARDAGLDELGLDPEPAARAAIDAHVRLLLAWTTAINLTAIRDPAAVARGHVIDSLTALPVISARSPRRLLDIGSGGGFPGLPLAAVLHDTDVTLLEPVGKKARFLTTVATAAGLADRVTVDARRAEQVAHDRERRGAWDVVTARAVASTAELVELAFPLLAPSGALVAWKRGDLTVELKAARRAIDALGGGMLDVIDVEVRGLDGHRLVIATRSPDTSVPTIYPRDPAQRRRRPW
jgi:16S rRNA (guanine527-N7)-methyltransferase